MAFNNGFWCCLKRGLVDSERDPPVAGNGEAPCSLAVAGELSPRSILRLAACA